MALISLSSELKSTKPADKSQAWIDSSSVMKILFAADFGITNQSLIPLEVDRDNFESLFIKLAVEIEISVLSDKDKLSISISDLDSFTPDELFQNLDVFKRLRQLRRQINNTKTYQLAVNEVQTWLDEDPEINETEVDALKRDAETTTDAGLLNNILGQAAEVKNQDVSLVDQLIKELVKPYVVAAAEPNKALYLAAIDDAIAKQMRNILHNEYFQCVESAWRDLYMLVKRLETGRSLKLFLMNSKKGSLHQSLLESEIDSSMTFIISHYSYRANKADIQQISELAHWGKQQNICILSSADASFMGLDKFEVNVPEEEWPTKFDKEIEKLWQDLRMTDEAHYICLSLPGFLSRYVYGKKFKPVNIIEFEEVVSGDLQNNYLWANSATLFALVIAQAFTQKSAQKNRVGGLATHYINDDGESLMLPCAEINLTTKAAELMTAKGLVPVYSVRNEDAVQLGKLASIANDRVLNLSQIKA